VSVISCDGIKIDVGHPLVTPRMAESFRGGTFEQFEVRIAKRVLEPGDRIIEMGTCSGYVALQAARIVGASNIICHEANPSAVQFAKANFALNNMDIAIRHCALMPASIAERYGGSVRFFLSPELNNSSIKKKAGESIAVPVKILEDAIRELNANVLIMDVEGAEVDILTNANLDGIEHILMETHYRKMGRKKIDEMIAHLYRIGFAIDLHSVYSGVVHMDRIGAPRSSSQ
jgi:FkbM family methyltransferase